MKNNFFIFTVLTLFAASFTCSAMEQKTISNSERLAKLWSTGKYRITHIDYGCEHFNEMAPECIAHAQKTPRQYTVDFTAKPEILFHTTPKYLDFTWMLALHKYDGDGDLISSIEEKCPIVIDTEELKVITTRASGDTKNQYRELKRWPQGINNPVFTALQALKPNAYFVKNHLENMNIVCAYVTAKNESASCMQHKVYLATDSELLNIDIPCNKRIEFMALNGNETMLAVVLEDGQLLLISPLQRKVPGKYMCDTHFRFLKVAENEK